MLAEAESVSKIMAQLEPLFQKDELREVFFIFYFLFFYCPAGAALLEGRVARGCR
jgi:hypothetical protein